MLVFNVLTEGEFEGSYEAMVKVRAKGMWSNLESHGEITVDSRDTIARASRLASLDNFCCSQKYSFA